MKWRKRAGGGMRAAKAVARNESGDRERGREPQGCRAEQGLFTWSAVQREANLWDQEQ